MAISQGNIILASDVGLTAGTTATASGINAAMGTSVSQGTLIQPISGRKYFIQNGKKVSGTSYSATGSVWQNWSNQSDHVWLTTYTGGSNDYCGAYVSPATIFTGQWKKLVIDRNGVGDTSYIGLTTNGSGKDPSFAARFTLWSRRDNWTGRSTQTFDISSITSGTLYIGIRLKAWLSGDEWGNVYGSGGSLKIYNLYLST